MIPQIQMNAQTRAFSVAYNVKSKFEEAYAVKMEGLNRVQQKM